MKNKPVIIAALLMAIPLVLVLGTYGTVSPCGILKKKLQREVVMRRVSETSFDYPVEDALAGALADPMIDGYVGALGPFECLQRVLAFERRRNEAAISSTKSDLRNLATAQEIYFAEHNRYAADLAVLARNLGGLEGFPLSYGVSITIHEAGRNGWSATATHVSTTDVCAIYRGDVDPVPPATIEGVVACEP